MVSHNRRQTLTRSLEHLRPLIDGELAELILIDNASTDPAQSPFFDRCPAHARHIRLNANTGVAAFNTGAIEARAHLLLILDDDAWVSREVLESAVARLNADNSRSAVALMPVHPNTGRPEWTWGASLSSPREDWPFLGAGLVVRTDRWHAVGGYEAGYFLYTNDTDLALKLLALGGGTGVHFDPALTVFHDSQSVEPRPLLWFRLATRNRVWMARRHVRWPGSLAYALTGWLAVHKRAGLNPRLHAAALLAGLRGLLSLAPPIPPRLRAGSRPFRTMRTLLRADGSVGQPTSTLAVHSSRLVATPPNPAASQPAHVTAVIPCFNRPAELEDLLTDLDRLHIPGNLTLDAIIIDNASTPPLSPTPQPRRTPVRVIRNTENTGGSGGFNTGMGAALECPDYAEFIWLLDSDVRLDPNALVTLLAAMQSDPRIIAAASELRDNASGFTYELGGSFDPRSGHLRPAAIGPHPFGSLIDADYLAACSLLVRRDAILRTGLMPDVFVYHDDVDWTIALKQATSGRLVAVPGSIAHHPFRRFATTLRYFESRNAFSPLFRLGVSRRVLFRRALLSTGLGVSLSILGFPELAELYPLGLADAASGRTTGRARAPLSAPIPAPHSRPLSELRDVLAELRRAGRTVRVHPSLERLIAAPSPAALLDAYTGQAHSEIFHAGLSRSLAISSFLTLARRLLTGPRDDAVVAPLGWGTPWLDAQTLVAVTGDRFFVTDVRPGQRFSRTVFLGVRCILSGLLIAMGPRRAHALPPAPVHAPARTTP